MGPTHTSDDIVEGPTTTPDPEQFRQRMVRPEPLGYVPALDGLRALAVLAVVFYHARFSWIPGGFLGVSAFFTLSGFLITSLVLREWAGTSGIDLRGFWNRRFRRLLPASWATMGIILVLGALGVWSTDQLREVRSDLPYSLLEIVNWHFIAADRSYAADFSAPSPFAHFWSLAVEQQFYVLLPLLAVAALTMGPSVAPRRRLQRLMALFVALAAFSAVANAVLSRESIDRAYYGTDTRMAEMLVGALLACATVRRLRLAPGVMRSIVIWVGAAGAVVTVLLWHEAGLRSAWLYPWGLLLTALCTAAVIFAAVQGGAFAAVLTFAPLVRVGRISYGIYLLHWPVFLWLTPARVPWSQWPLFVLRMTVTVAASVLMFRVIENPIRRGRRIQRPYGWLAALLMAALLLAGSFVLTSDLAPSTALSISAPSPTHESVADAPPAVRVLFVGDQIASAAAESLQGHDGIDASASVEPSCGLALGGWVRLASGEVERDVDRCRGTRDRWLADAVETRPDVVVLMGSMRDAADRRLSAGAPWGGPAEPTNDDFLRTDFGSLVDSFAGTDAEIVLATMPRVRNTETVAATPLVLPVDANARPLAEAEAATVALGVPPAGFAENDDARVDHVNRLLAAAAASRGVRLLDLGAESRTWAGEGLDTSLRPDGVGFSEKAGELLGEWLLPLLRDARPDPVEAPPLPSVEPDAPLPSAPPTTPRRVLGPSDRLDVLVVGDSVARNLGFGLAAWSGQVDDDVAVNNSGQLGCAIARGGTYRFKRDVRTFEPFCDWGTTFPSLVSGIRPDVVVIASGIWDVADRRLPGDDRFRHIGDAGFDRYLLSEYLGAVDVLSSDGATVILTTQPRIRPGLDQGFQNLPEGEPVRIDRLNAMLERVAELRPDTVRLVDLRGWLQQQPGGEDDATTRPDGIHFTDDHAVTVGAWLGPDLVRIARGG